MKCARQAFDIRDCVAQDLHLGQPLVWVARRAAFERLEGLKTLAPRRRCSRMVAAFGGAVGVSRLAFARLAGLCKQRPRLVVPAGRAHMFVLARAWGPGAPLQGSASVPPASGERAHVHEARIQVLEEAQIRGVETRVIIEVIRCKVAVEPSGPVKSTSRSGGDSSSISRRGAAVLAFAQPQRQRQARNLLRFWSPGNERAKH